MGDYHDVVVQGVTASTRGPSIKENFLLAFLEKRLILHT